MTTQLPDVTDDDTTTAEAPVTTTEDDVTKLTGTFEDTTTKPSDTTTQPSDITIKLNDNSSKDPSNASCKDLIKVFEAKEDHLKQYYKNDHATKVFVLKIHRNLTDNDIYVVNGSIIFSIYRAVFNGNG